ncbi:hypothetical protein OEA41_005059 [Lepraria neglecta]|uniref:DUF6604 domain-containing protein n=1 Tax=Lepraria neglecta TaxID=209136 RepID=A0AAE0DGC3_9LECA|nr:hypothetical protein OEA41_005059 [Lepraria neglecta]
MRLSNGWQQQQASTPTCLLNELRQAAEITKSRRVEIPTEILWAFELAIDARTDISEYFKQMTGFKDEKTRYHEHFTKTLKLIYKLLRGKQQSAGGKMTSASSKGQQPTKSQNRYDHLPKVSNEPEVEIFAAAEDNAAVLGEEPTSSVEEPLEPELSLKDDDMVKDFELYYGAIFLSGHGLVSRWKAFLGSLRTAPPLRPGLEKSTNYITVQSDPEDEPRQFAAERSVLDLLLNSMHRVILSNEPKKSDKMLINPDFLREMNPPISGLIEFILSEEKACQTHAMFGLQLLAESYKSFTIPNHEQLHPTAASKCLDSLRMFEVVLVIYENASLSNVYAIVNAKGAWEIRSRKLFRS